MPGEGRTHANDADTWRLAVETAVFTVLFPGTVTVVLPALVLRRTGRLFMPEGSIRLVPALLLLAVGVGMYLACAGAFVSAGHGTPAPIDPPRRLVLQGLYRRSRNPMYLSVLTVLVGEALLFASTALLVYAAIVLGIFHLFVVLYEEPTLRGTFGEAYERYCCAVPRWLGRARAR
jgi:protein-S-isoprenylcysteine O-methyltransferase Ste14